MMNIERLTEEEYQAAMRAINEVREEKQASAAKKILDQGVTMMIELVGVEQTKALLREKNRELRKGE